MKSNTRRCRREKVRFVDDGDRGRKMIEFKITLMVVMIAILLFAVYFTAIPG